MLPIENNRGQKWPSRRVFTISLASCKRIGYYNIGKMIVDTQSMYFIQLMGPQEQIKKFIFQCRKNIE